MYEGIGLLRVQNDAGIITVKAATQGVLLRTTAILSSKRQFLLPALSIAIYKERRNHNTLASCSNSRLLGVSPR
jgi:hypothetical protein